MRQHIYRTEPDNGKTHASQDSRGVADSMPQTGGLGARTG